MANSRHSRKSNRVFMPMPPEGDVRERALRKGIRFEPPNAKAYELVEACLPKGWSYQPEKDIYHGIIFNGAGERVLYFHSGDCRGSIPSVIDGSSQIVYYQQPNIIALGSRHRTGGNRQDDSVMSGGIHPRYEGSQVDIALNPEIHKDYLERRRQSLLDEAQKD